ncbi:MAG: radical SAM protein [candidate division WOR-3 bacterium]
MIRTGDILLRDFKLVESFPGLNIKKEGIVLTGNDKSLFFIDKEGRILYVFLENKGYRIGLSGEIIEKKRKNGEKLINRFKSLRFLKEIYKRAENTLEDEFFKENKSFLKDFLKRGYKNFKRTIKSFKEVYGKVPIVPPDMYLSLYIQVTRGCSYNKCTFCNFYKGEKFRVLSKEELILHINKVKKFFGEGIKTRKNIFLGDADALLLTEDRIFEYFKLIKNSFKEENLSKISSFLDVWTGRKKNLNFWQTLKELSLFRVYIGLESGSENLLKRLNKPFNPEEFIFLVENLKKIGISVGVIILLGIAGDLEEEHKSKTYDLLKNLSLDKSDILYLSPYYPFKGLYPEEANYEEIKREIDFFKLLFSEKKIRVSVYDIREFVY